jgi:hypothetical protein
MTFKNFARYHNLPPDNLTWQIYRVSGELKKHLLERVASNGDDSPELQEMWAKVFEEAIETRWANMPLPNNK